MVEKILGKGAPIVPDYNKELQELLNQTVNVNRGEQLPLESHIQLMIITGTQFPTNKSASNLYCRWAAGTSPIPLVRVVCDDLGKYLSGIGILQVPPGHYKLAQ